MTDREVLRIVEYCFEYTCPEYRDTTFICPVCHESKGHGHHNTCIIGTQLSKPEVSDEELAKEIKEWYWAISACDDSEMENEFLALARKIKEVVR